jgi:hypothetical protein
VGRKKVKVTNKKTASLAFNAGRRAHGKGFPITHYKGNNAWYKREWQRGWGSVGLSYQAAQDKLHSDVTDLGIIIQNGIYSVLQKLRIL